MGPGDYHSVDAARYCRLNCIRGQPQSPEQLSRPKGAAEAPKPVLGGFLTFPVFTTPSAGKLEMPADPVLEGPLRRWPTMVFGGRRAR